MADAPDRSAGPQPEQRRDSRFRYFGVVFLSWIEPDGDNHVMGRCLDLSEGGLRVEVARRISIGTEVRVRADWMNLDGEASVRHVTRAGGIFQLGLQLKQRLPPEIIAKLAASGPR